MLALLAGAFIAFGAVLHMVVVTGGTFGFGATRLLGAVALPIAAFVAIGFQHSIGNMVFLPWDLVGDGADGACVQAALANIAVVSLANIVGGPSLWPASTGAPTCADRRRIECISRNGQTAAFMARSMWSRR
jgi:formate/nitrite transporter FocA (FNT family)